MNRLGLEMGSWQAGDGRLRPSGARRQKSGAFCLTLRTRGRSNNQPLKWTGAVRGAGCGGLAFMVTEMDLKKV